MTSTRWDGIWTFIWRLAVFVMVLWIMIHSVPISERARVYQETAIERLDSIQRKLIIIDTFITQQAYDKDRAETRALINAMDKDIEEIRRYVGIPSRKTKSPK